MTNAFVDGTIVCLLAGTVGYAFLVDRRVRALMSALNALKPTVEAFAQAADRTEATVSTLTAGRAAVPNHDVGGGFRSARPGSPAGAPRGEARAPGLVPVPVRDDLIHRFFHPTHGGRAR